MARSKQSAGKGTGCLLIVAVLVLVRVVVWILAAAYCFAAAFSVITLSILDLLLGTGFTPGAPEIMWAVWGVISGALLGFWTIAPVYGLRKWRSVLVALPLLLMGVAGIVFPPVQDGTSMTDPDAPHVNPGPPMVPGTGVIIHWRIATSDYRISHPGAANTRLWHGAAAAVRIYIENRSLSPVELAPDSFWLVNPPGEALEAQSTPLPGMLIRSTVAPGATATFWLLFTAPRSQQVSYRLECRSLPGARIALNQSARPVSPSPGTHTRRGYASRRSHRHTTTHHSIQ